MGIARPGREHNLAGSGVVGPQVLPLAHPSFFCPAAEHPIAEPSDRSPIHPWFPVKTRCLFGVVFEGFLGPPDDLQLHVIQLIEQTTFAQIE